MKRLIVLCRLRFNSNFGQFTPESDIGHNKQRKYIILDMSHKSELAPKVCSVDKAISEMLEKHKKPNPSWKEHNKGNSIVY